MYEESTRTKTTFLTQLVEVPTPGHTETRQSPLGPSRASHITQNYQLPYLLLGVSTPTSASHLNSLIGKEKLPSAYRGHAYWLFFLGKLAALWFNPRVLEPKCLTIKAWLCHLLNTTSKSLIFPGLCDLICGKGTMTVPTTPSVCGN